MLLRPIPFHTRSTARNADGVSQAWLTEQQVLDLFGGVWRESTPLEDCQVLEVIVIPVGYLGPVIDNLEQYSGLAGDYIDDLRADPSIHAAFITSDNGNRCVIYRIGPQNHEYWYCDTGVEDPNWLTNWLDYANNHNLYYYGCGFGANALFYYPHDTAKYRNRFSFSFRDPDLGYYEPSWELAPDGALRRATGSYHSLMQDSSQGERMQISKDSQGVSYRVRQRARPILFAEEGYPLEKMASLSNLLHRNDFVNVLVCLHEDFLVNWQEERMESALRNIATDMGSIVWRGETWYLIEVPDPVHTDLVLRTVHPLEIEQAIEVAQYAHVDDLLEKLTSNGKKTWLEGKEYVAVTDKAMSDGIVEELNRPLNYQSLRKRKTSFGSIRIGARTSDSSVVAPFEKPLSPIPPQTDITIEFTERYQRTPQNTDWFNANLNKEADDLAEFGRKVQEQLRPDLPPLKFVRPGQFDIDKMTEEMSQAYGTNPAAVRKMLEIWSQYLNNDPAPPQGSFDRAGPTSAGWNPDGVTFHDSLASAMGRAPKGRDVLRHRTTGVKVYVVRRRYGTVTLQSEDGQEFTLNNDIVETVYEKEDK